MAASVAQTTCRREPLFQSLRVRILLYGSAEKPEEDTLSQEESFLDDVLDLVTQRLAEGQPLDVDEVAAGRPHLRARVEALVVMAREAAVRWPRASSLSSCTLNRARMGSCCSWRRSPMPGGIALGVSGKGSESSVVG